MLIRQKDFRLLIERCTFVDQGEPCMGSSRHLEIGT
jgi:hypothetical protein